MGLFKELALLPLAPVRGTAWIAEQLNPPAEDDPSLAPRIAPLTEQFVRAKDIALIRQSRLSVQPLTKDAFDTIVKMGR